MSDRVGYDGAKRTRPDAIARIARDLAAFARDQAGRADDAAGWAALLAEVRASDGFGDGWAADAFCHLEWASETALRITPMSHLRGELPALERQLAAMPWCERVSAHPGPPAAHLIVELSWLGSAEQRAIEGRIRADGEDRRARLRRGVAALCALVAPDPVPGADDELARALASVDEAERAQLARLARFR